ncbi:hypothetical protein Slin14017_G043630 [Septoria linicola]|nr:hypothetical protein Slin14017_G043630 [Septoria linicola]
MSNDLYRSCMTLMSRLKRLSMHFDSLPLAGRDLTGHLTAHRLLRHFLTSAVQPRSLNLDIPYLGKTVSLERSMCLTDLLSNSTFPYLQKVKLAGVQVRSDELPAFVHRHRGTLRELSLRGLVYQGSWEGHEFLANVAAELSVLRNIEFSGWLDVNGGTFRNPPSRFRLAYNMDLEAGTSFGQVAFKRSRGCQFEGEGLEDATWW